MYCQIDILFSPISISSYWFFYPAAAKIARVASMISGPDAVSSADGNFFILKVFRQRYIGNYSYVYIYFVMKSINKISELTINLRSLFITVVKPKALPKQHRNCTSPSLLFLSSLKFSGSIWHPFDRGGRPKALHHWLWIGNMDVVSKNNRWDPRINYRTLSHQANWLKS